jgi:hypothetical protein
MTRKMIAVAAAAVAALLLSGTLDSADARKGGWSGGGFHGGARSFGGGKFHGFSGGKFHGGFHKFHGGSFHHHGYKFGKFHHHGHKFHRHFHGYKRHYFVGVPFAAYGAYAYAGGGCYWLRKQALYTGSPYWWNRYYDCLYGYGYY